MFHGESELADENIQILQEKTQQQVFRSHFLPDHRVSSNKEVYYAQHLILVNFLLVNFFTKMKIARNPEGFQVPGVVEMNPTGLPELF